MSLYDKAKKNCTYGYFDEKNPAGYVLTEGDKLCSPWYYIYTNRKILLYVDQNGPVKVQYQPPSGILLTKREIGETQSKWQVWIQSEKLNGGIPISNFNSPWLRIGTEKPKMEVSWQPEKATYSYTIENIRVVTEIFVPCDKATVCMKTTLTNLREEEMLFTITPAIFPYINVPQMVAWDLPEWYLSSKIHKNGEMLTIHGQMSDPLMIKENERSITINFDYDEDAEVELDMSRFAGSGNFFTPASVVNNSAFGRMEESDGKSFGGQQTVYTARYRCALKAGASKTFTQVMTVQEGNSYDAKQNEYERNYFEENRYLACVEKTKDFYSHLFGKRTIKTGNELLNNFINYFTPLQMYWVCSLDRGWPSSMRGVRDASQDFMGMTHLDPVWTRELIISLFEHQQTDGWMPRQISTISREAPHDMRYFSDGGAFLLELIHEYLTFTRDYTILKEKTVWLNSDENSTVMEHLLRCVDFYLRDENIGEHGLCKAWYGDWWDVMDRIGMEGRGETVTVTAQNVLNLKNLIEMLDWLYALGEIDESIYQLKEKYAIYRERFINAMRTYAFNEEGFFNGYFNDNGKWLLSDNDVDGESRLYLVSNAWAIISGCATEKMRKSVLGNIEKKNFCGVAYNTSSKGYAIYVDKAGRVGNGSRPKASSYNHAQSFLVRACCVAGDAEMAYKVSRCIYPIEEEYAPVEKTMAPPYAIVNAYSNETKRAGFQFLSGTVSYVLRSFYSFFFGITYEYDGLSLRPCISEKFGDFEVHFEYLGKKFIIRYFKAENEKSVALNGRIWKKTRNCEENGKEYPFFADEDMDEENIVEINY